MNAIFTAVILISAAIMAAVAPQNFLPAMLDGAKQSITVGVTLFCIYAVWMGIGSVAEKCGINGRAAKLLKPFCARFFRTDNKEACADIAMNLTCNFLGIGASTPYAVRAIDALEKDNNAYAQKLLFVVNATGIQLFPSTVIALRASSGSIAAADIFLPCLICCIAGTALGVLLFILTEKLGGLKRKK